MKSLLVLCALAAACHSKDITNGDQIPAPADSAGTTIVVSEALDAAPPDCTVHLVSDAFSPEVRAEGAADRPKGTGMPHATPTGKVRVEGDYTRTLAKVEVERGGAAGHPSSVAWSGTFKGPRDAFFETLRRHVCTAPRVYALKAEGNKDPTKGAVVLDVFEMTPDDKADVANLCHAVSSAPGADAGNVDLRDRAVMAWVEDTMTTTKWDRWRQTFAHERGDLLATKGDPKPLFHQRGNDLASAAQALGLACPTADEWKKR